LLAGQTAKVIGDKVVARGAAGTGNVAGAGPALIWAEKAAPIDCEVVAQAASSANLVVETD
jgi:hypothetical protein